MRVRDLPLAPAYVEHFEDLGIDELYPPQAAAVEAGIADGESLVAAIPTASGKTFVAQLAMVTADGPALYVVPLRALATEKYETFAEVPDLSVGIATGDYDESDEDLRGQDVVVATSEKVDAALRQDADWATAAACVVVDEIHLLDDPERGPTLEVTLAKLRRRTPGLQVVGLSATVGNAEAIAGWLDAELVESDWRPVDLLTGVYDGREIAFGDGSTRTLPAEGVAPTTALVREAIADGGGCLVFVGSRRAARALAEDVTDEDLDHAPEVAEQLRTAARTATGTALARCAAFGVAFHHAGLAGDQRSTVERAFRERALSVIVATPTLAAGVNVPARRVIVRDHRRWTGDAYEPLPVLEVQQMFGRAGRPGLDPYGEAILVAGEDEADAVAGRYLDAEPEAVTSKLDSPAALRDHVLATVAAGTARSRTALRAVLSGTFYAHTGDVADLDGGVASAIEDLAGVGMIQSREGAELAATDLGRLVSRVYVDPITGADVLAALERAADVEHPTALTILEIVCDTPDMHTGYVRDDEAGRLSEFAMDNADRLAKSVTDFEGNFHGWLPALKTALVLEEWLAGVDAGTIEDRYGVEPGDLARLAERAEWLLGATASLADHADSALTDLIRETHDRLAESDIEG